MVDHVSPLLEVLKAFNQLIISACVSGFSSRIPSKEAGVKIPFSCPSFGLLHTSSYSLPQNLSCPTNR